MHTWIHSDEIRQIRRYRRIYQYQADYIAAACYRLQLPPEAEEQLRRTEPARPELPDEPLERLGHGVIGG